MLVEVVVWGGSTLISGLGVGYYFLGKYDEKNKRSLKNINEAIEKKFQEIENDDVVPQELKKLNSQHSNISIEKEDAEITVEDELYRLARIADLAGYFDYYVLKRPERPKYGGMTWEVDYYKLEYNKWKKDVDEAHPFDMTLVSFIEKHGKEINREHEIEMLVYKYSYTWDTYEQIVKEAKQLNTLLSDAVKREIYRGITQFIIDYCELEYRILKHQKQLKDEMDAATNNSFMQRLQLEREYINKVRNKEEFDLTLNNI